MLLLGCLFANGHRERHREREACTPTKCMAAWRLVLPHLMSAATMYNSQHLRLHGHRHGQTHTPYNPPDNPSLYNINVQYLHLEHSHPESVLLWLAISFCFESSDLFLTVFHFPCCMMMTCTNLSKQILSLSYQKSFLAHLSIDVCLYLHPFVRTHSKTQTRLHLRRSMRQEDKCICNISGMMLQTVGQHISILVKSNKHETTRNNMSFIIQES